MENTGSNIFRLEKRIFKSPTNLEAQLIFPGEKVNKLSRVSMEAFEKNVLPKLESMAKENRIDALVLVSGSSVILSRALTSI